MASVDIGREIAAILQEYAEEIEDGLADAEKKVAQNGAAELRKTSPKGKYKGGGSYAKNWSAKKLKDGGYVIYNRKRYQLTHLLEKGHAKVGGGRVSGIPHIQPVEEQVIREFEREVERVIRG